ncbi:hypothetical protein ACNPM8_11480 [Glutamicibacter sp. AGC46]
MTLINSCGNLFNGANRIHDVGLNSRWRLHLRDGESKVGSSLFQRSKLLLERGGIGLILQRLITLSLGQRIQGEAAEQSTFVLAHDMAPSNSRISFILSREPAFTITTGSWA